MHNLHTCTKCHTLKLEGTTSLSLSGGLLTFYNSLYATHTRNYEHILHIYYKLKLLLTQLKCVLQNLLPLKVTHTCQGYKVTEYITKLYTVLHTHKATITRYDTYTIYKQTMQDYKIQNTPGIQLSCSCYTTKCQTLIRPILI